MFSGKAKDKAAVQQAAVDKVSIVAAGMTVSGDIETSGDIRIDGTVRGNVSSKSKIVIIGTGRVDGDVDGIHVDIHGQVTGNVTARETLTLRAASKIIGDLATNKLHIEAGAVFQGYCTMSAPRRHKVVTEAGEIVTESD